jgi:predicted HNH restriction endonuclease
MKYFCLADLKQVFKAVAAKLISRTDIGKAAYVVPQHQKQILDMAGIQPGTYPKVTRFKLHVLGEGQTIEASYYASQRKGSGRPPEFRMGRFIQQLKEGDELAFATDGRDVFVCMATQDVKGTPDVTEAYEETATKIDEELSDEELLSRVKGARSKPETRLTSTTVYNRDPAIIAFVRRRSQYRCEVSECEYEGFVKDDGKRYIQTHHIVPLSEKGEDSPHNVAAVCPNCHSALHYSRDRKKLSRNLMQVVKEANERAGLK